MTVTAAQGFDVGGAAAGIRESCAPEQGPVVDRSPSRAVAGVLASRRIRTRPVRCSRGALAYGRLSAAAYPTGLIGVRPPAGGITEGIVAAMNASPGVSGGAGVLAPGPATTPVATDVDVAAARLDPAPCAGDDTATAWTDDLTAEHVHENGACGS